MVAFPSCPFPLKPQVNTRPLEVSAVDTLPPKDNSVITSSDAIVNREVISIGLLLFIKESLPSWPSSFNPHVNMRPVEVSAPEYELPKDILVIV